MGFAELQATTKAILGLAFLYVVYYSITSLELWSRRRAFKRERGVLSATRLPQKDTIFGLDLFFENIKALKNHNLLEVATARFQNVGTHTFRLVALGRHMHVTLDSENLKTIQAIDHKKWSLGTRRKIGFRPLLGDGQYQSASQA